MLTKTVTAISILSATRVFAAYGCSSNNSGIATTPDAGTVFPNDSGIGTNDSAAVGSNDDGPGTDDSGAVGSNDDGPGTDDAAIATCPGLVENVSIPAYIAPTTTPGACTPDEIASYAALCASASASQATCNTWSGSTGCTYCVAPIGVMTGGLFVLTAMGPQPNTPGCIALIDPVNGPTCAPAFWKSYQCPFTACSSCTSAASSDSCLASVPAPCQSYELLTDEACAADRVDGGPANVNGPCNDPLTVLTLFCGGGDAGAPADGGL